MKAQHFVIFHLFQQTLEGNHQGFLTRIIPAVCCFFLKLEAYHLPIEQKFAIRHFGVYGIPEPGTGTGAIHPSRKILFSSFIGSSDVRLSSLLYISY
jgi:hypothetical protein